MLDFVAVFGCEHDFPWPISYTELESGRLIEAPSFLEAVYIASERAARHYAIQSVERLSGDFIHGS